MTSETEQCRAAMLFVLLLYGRVPMYYICDRLCSHRAELLLMVLLFAATAVTALRDL